MEVIRDEEFNGLLMVPLFNQWGLNKCNINECPNKHTTIIAGLTDRPFAVCEDHYNEFKVKGKIKCTINY